MTRTAKHFGFSRTKKIIVAFVTLLVAIMFTIPITGTKTYAEDTNSKDLNTVLLPYAQELEKINSELGTDYIFVPGEELSETEYNDLVDFYQQMTLEEFRDYIFRAYENDISNQNDFAEFEFSFNCTVNENLHSSDGTQILSTNPVSTITQKYYYSSNKNYLAITVDVMYGDGRAYYLDNVVTYEGHIDTYPGFRIEKGSYDFNSSQTEMYVIFTCKRYTANGVQNATTYTIPVTFKAGGGDVYKTYDV